MLTKYLLNERLRDSDQKRGKKRHKEKGGDTGVREAELGEKWERRARWGCWAKWGERNEEGRRQRELGCRATEIRVCQRVRDEDRD